MRSVVVRDRVMDEKNLSATEGSQPPVEGSGSSSDETKDLSETEGSQPLEGSGVPTLGDPTRIGRTGSSAV